jgi:transcription-repair coupling factor (superfamily II helicase)
LANFIAVLTFKRYLSKHGVQKADIFPDRLRLAFAEGSSVNPASLVHFVLDLQSRGQHVRLQPPAVLDILLTGNTVEEALGNARIVLQPVLEPDMPDALLAK